MEEKVVWSPLRKIFRNKSFRPHDRVLDPPLLFSSSQYQSLPAAPQSPCKWPLAENGTQTRPQHLVLNLEIIQKAIRHLQNAQLCHQSRRSRSTAEPEMTSNQKQTWRRGGRKLSKHYLWPRATRTSARYKKKIPE